MSGEKIALIIDKSRAYNTYQRDKLLTEWGIKEAPDKVSGFSDATGETLFGDTPTVEMHLTTAEEVKEAAAYLDKRRPGEIADAFPNGLLITCEVPRTSTKKLEAYFKKHSLTFVLPPTAKEDSLPEKLLSDLALKPGVKKFILEYVGDEYESLISLVDRLAQIPKKQHSLISEEDIIIRFPQEKGDLPAWDVEKHVLDGNVKAAIETARRVSATMLWITLLRKKLESYYKVAALLESHPSMKDDDVVALLGLPARGFYFTKKAVKAHPVNSFERAMELMLIAEGNMKGGSSAPNDALAEELLVRLCGLFKARY